MLKNICLQQINLLKTCVSLQQQVRTTFILKRKYEPPLHKINQKPKKLRGRHHIYELIEDTTTSKHAEIEVVLKTFVEGVGGKGDVISIKPNVAYNKLLLPGLAVYKTEENVSKYAKKENEKVDLEHSSRFAQRTVNMLERLNLSVVMNKDHPWVIEPWHIKASLRKAGYICQEECITIPKEPIEGPDLKKESKEFYCIVTINNSEKARVKCRIHHWSTDPSERLPYVFEYWKIPSEPLIGIQEPAKGNDTIKST